MTLREEHGNGVIFSFDPSTSTYTKMKDFDDTNGDIPLWQPYAGKRWKALWHDNLGGSSDYGVIFSFDPSSSTYTKLKDFDGNNGSEPHGSLMQASNGKLYGMTLWAEAAVLALFFPLILPLPLIQS